jgi:hypothetical protein
MTFLIAILSVLILLGCLDTQLARTLTGAKSNSDPLAASRVGKHHAQLRAARDGRDAWEFAEFATSAQPGIAAEPASNENR